MLAKNRWGICWANLERKIEKKRDDVRNDDDFFFCCSATSSCLSCLICGAHLHTNTWYNWLGWQDSAVRQSEQKSWWKRRIKNAKIEEKKEEEKTEWNFSNCPLARVAHTWEVYTWWWRHTQSSEFLIHSLALTHAGIPCSFLFCVRSFGRTASIHLYNSLAAYNIKWDTAKTA